MPFSINLALMLKDAEDKLTAMTNVNTNDTAVHRMSSLQPFH